MGPDRFSTPVFNLQKNIFGAVLTLILSVIVVALVLPPSRVDKFVDWWYGL